MSESADLRGVCAAQLNLGNDRDGNIHTIMERVFLNTDLVKDNYFFLGYMLGYYTEQCCPRYLMVRGLCCSSRVGRNGCSSGVVPGLC